MKCTKLFVPITLLIDMTIITGSDRGTMYQSNKFNWNKSLSSIRMLQFVRCYANDQPLIHLINKYFTTQSSNLSISSLTCFYFNI